MLCPKKLPISPGVILKPEDVPVVPEQHKQKYYLAFVAKLQFTATWVHMDMPFTVSQLCIGRRSAMSSTALSHGVSGRHSNIYMFQRILDISKLLSGYFRLTSAVTLTKGKQGPS
jgi:hypothetical protein